MRLTLMFLPALVAALAACGDPLRDGKIEALGSEEEGFPPSANHRPGQPCVLCHGAYFGASPTMVFGGTIFLEPEEPGGDLVGLPGYVVRLIDSESKIRDVTTNACGNFFLTEDDYRPAYPVRAELRGPSLADADRVVQVSAMSTRIGRDGSCGACHIEPLSPFSPGAVFVPRALFNPDAIEVPAEGSCPTPRFQPIFSQ